MKANNFKAAVCEMTSGECVASNLQQLLSLLTDAASLGAEFISFPENSLYMRVDEKKERFALTLDHPAFQQIAGACRSQNVCVHLGSVPCWVEGELKNATIVITENGDVHHLYDKIHLFDIELTGKKPVRESDYFSAGMSPKVFEWRGFRIGLAICYDLRFSELFYWYAKQNVDLLMIPAAFLVETGRAHWEVLLRARAIESQCYVLAAAQVGEHQSESGAKRQTFGHSMIVDPWGVVLGLAGDNQKLVTAEISKDRIEEVRRQLPMTQHRKLSIERI